jgi:hypothetical protein
MEGGKQGSVEVIGSSPFNSRSPSPSGNIKGSSKGIDLSGNVKIPKPNNGWSREQEELMAGWADIAACYRWMHDKCEKKMNVSNLWMTVPVIVLSTLSGSASFILNSVVGDNPTGQKYAQIGIGSISIFTGILTTLGNFFRYAQSSEANRVAGIAWGKFQRQIAVELALHPNERIECSDFLTMCRAELDRLIEQSPPIPDYIVVEFEKEFENVPVLKRPDIAHGVEHTMIYKNNDSRLKQLVVDAAVLMKQKKKTWHELLLPDIEKKLETEFEKRLSVFTARIDELEKKGVSKPVATRMNTLARPMGRQVIPLMQAIDQSPRLESQLANASNASNASNGTEQRGADAPEPPV